MEARVLSEKEEGKGREGVYIDRAFLPDTRIDRVAQRHTYLHPTAPPQLQFHNLHERHGLYPAFCVVTFQFS